MQPTYVKLKLPVKAFQAFLLIMVICQQCSLINGQLRCFGPVWKTNVFNIDNGLVYVNKVSKQIFINKSDSSDSFLYKISTPLNAKKRGFHPKFHRNPLRAEESHAFYLFDPHTRTFICWKNVNGTMSAMTYEEINRNNRWHLCKFSDHIPEDERYKNTYVNLQLAGHPGTTMRFDRKGRIIPHKRIQKCLKKNRHLGRHSKRCFGSNIFLLYHENSHEDCCSEAYKALCKGKTQHMPELRDKCQLARSCERNP
ncbi:uncharacterized protein LOC126733755 isoform X1 [Anthonomus grandis grandis]|uniref:uncharacterized protein LOC126733755 isoform X1 n=1 Tax=Anthonomus grandis grandis TaxID=2921223 RepID=UPI002165923E|nr:uncharacterized protein LOC126733755 isoform X1 [Anthonomus grandis grandis]